MNRIFSCLLLSLVSFSAFSQSTIDEKDVTRIITTLASDAMNGRKAFTPDADRAVDFISSEFTKTELGFFGNLTSYQQSFEMFRFKNLTAKVQLNGKMLSENEVLYSGSFETIKWQNAPNVYSIDSTDNFWDKWDELKNLTTDAVIVIHPAHDNVFSWMKRRAKGDRYIFEKNNGPSKILVETNEKSVQSFTAEIRNSLTPVTGKNVVGIIPGSERKNEYVIFSAHYDHIGVMRPVEGDSIANGADDDASGVTAVITLANHFNKIKSNKRTLIFVLFTAEEMGGFGSQYFSKQLNPDEVVAMFNIEMIGKPSIFGENSGFMTGYEMSSLGEIVKKNLEKTPFKIHPDPYPKQQLFYRSDNKTLAELGVPAHSFSSDPIDVDKFYHTVNDEVETLNLTHLTQMIKAIAAGSESVISGKDTPTRVAKKK